MNEIPVEIIGEEEMALIEAALSYASNSLASDYNSTAIVAPASLSDVNCSSVPSTRIPEFNIEDFGKIGSASRSLVDRFRRKRTLSVTDFTAVEWCEKQMEFSLIHGKPEQTEAMKTGSTRHTELEKEVMVRIDIPVKTQEDMWGIRFLNFIVGINQLLTEGMTREIMVIGSLEEDIWVIGVIDEIRMPMDGPLINPLLVDTKTRNKPTLPSEPQKRNARFQLMFYKFLWDNIIGENFSSEQFFIHFDLDPKRKLSEDVKKFGNSLGFQHNTLEDVVVQFQEVCNMLPRSKEHLLLRYEFQGDRSGLGEFMFLHDHVWFMGQVRKALDFWLGIRRGNCVSWNEKWKCNFCKFNNNCSQAIKPNTEE